MNGHACSRDYVSLQFNFVHIQILRYVNFKNVCHKFSIFAILFSRITSPHFCEFLTTFLAKHVAHAIWLKGIMQSKQQEVFIWCIEDALGYITICNQDHTELNESVLVPNKYNNHFDSAGEVKTCYQPLQVPNIAAHMHPALWLMLLLC